VIALRLLGLLVLVTVNGFFAAVEFPSSPCGFRVSAN